MLKTDGPSHLHCKNRKLKFLCGSSCVMMDSVSLLLFMGTISASLSFIVVYVITAVRMNCWGHQWPSSWRVRESTYALCLFPNSRDGRPNPSCLPQTVILESAALVSLPPLKKKKKTKHWIKQNPQFTGSHLGGPQSTPSCLGAMKGV